jgi:hypothetical protein
LIASDKRRMAVTGLTHGFEVPAFDQAPAGRY